MIDLPEFFLQTEQENDTQILLRMENEKWVIYVMCNKTIYGTMNANLLAYRKLAKLLTDSGFGVNVYDPWNANAIGDDGTNTNANANANGNAARNADAKANANAKAMGDANDTEAIDDNKNTNDVTEVNANGYKCTPAQENLFEVNENDYKLHDGWKEDYHKIKVTAKIKITAKTLWVSQQSGLDVQLSMGFHCPRVKFPGEQDWKKMKHL